MKNYSLRLKLSTIHIAAFIWGAIPVLQTIPFWFRLQYAVIVEAAAITAVILIISRIYQSSSGKKGGTAVHTGNLTSQSNQIITITPRIWILLIFIAIWMVVIGIGGFVTQEGWDNAYRNAVLFELVKTPWPVKHIVDGQVCYLSYYFSFWLPAATVGKVLHSYIASQAALFLYCWIGLSLATLMIINYCRKRPFTVGILLFFICGYDFINQVIFHYLLRWHNDFYCGTHIAGTPVVIYLCRFIYNQGIPAMVLLPLMYSYKKCRSILIFLFALIFTVAPFVAIPLAGILFILFIKTPRKFISIENCAGLMICLLMAIFFSGNKNSSITTVFNVGFTPGQVLILLLSFFVTNYCIYLPFIWRRIKHDKLFWGLLVFTIPFFFICTTDQSFDYGWKVPIPFTLYFYVLVLKEVANMDWENRKGRYIALSCVLAIALWGNYHLYERVYVQHYKLFVLKDTTQKRDEYFTKILFSKNPELTCRDNFIQEEPTLYSEYFAPPDAPISPNHWEVK